MNELITEGIIIKESKKPSIHLYKRVSCTTGNMKVKCKNLFIRELKVNSPSTNPERSFVMSIRQDGVENGNYKLSQIHLTKKDLIRVRNSINDILDFED